MEDAAHQVVPWWGVGVEGGGGGVGGGKLSVCRLKGDVASLCVNISGSAEHVSFYVISAPHRVRFTKKKCERVKERGM